MPAPPSLPGARAPGALGSEVGPPLPALHPLQGAAPHPVRPRQTRPPRGVSPPTCPAGGPAGVLAAPTPQSPASVPMSRGWAQPSYRGAQGSAPDGW